MSGTMWAVAGLLLAACMLGALVPLIRKWSQAGLHLFVAVAVGIFLGTLFLHLMPELTEPAPESAAAAVTAAESAHGHLGESPREPWVAALVGLLTLFLIEKIWLQGKSHVHAPAPTVVHDHDHDHHGHDHGHAHAHAQGPAAVVKATSAASASGANPVADHPPGEVCDHDPHSYDSGHTRERHALVWYASFLGLTIHAVFDGISTAAMLVGGVIPWPFVVSILVHKASEGFSLATVIRLGGVPVRKTLGFLLVFALVTPLGMIAGGLLAEQIGPTHLGMLRGFAAGTFLYVAVYDLLPEVFHDANQRLLRCFAVGLGVVIVAVSRVYTH